MDIVTVLKQAKSTIAHPSAWTWFVVARDAHGSPVEFNSPHAVRFCSAGAVMRAAGGDNLDSYKAHAYLEFIADEMVSNGVNYLNDRTNHETVMNMFDRAIELAKEKNVYELSIEISKKREGMKNA